MQNIVKFFKLNTLYSKIFLSFWLVMVLTAIIVSIFHSLLIRSDNHSEKYHKIEHQIERHALDASEAYNKNNLEGLKNWLQEFQMQSLPVNVLILDDSGHDILGGRLPRGLKRMLKRHKDHSPIGSWQKYSVHKIITDEDKHFRLLVSRNFPKVSRFFHQAWVRLVTLLITLIVSIIVCFYLARYLSKPIRALQAAGRQVAEGDFSVRVGKLLGRRRDEVAELAHDFDAMVERVEKLLSAHKNLLASVSHELRSPLARQSIAIELLRQQNHALNSNIYLSRIENEIEKLDQLIGQILAYMRLEQKTLVLNKEHTSISGLLEEIIEDATFEGSIKKIKITYRCRDDIFVSIDVALIRSAIENILRNAIFYSKENSQIKLDLYLDKSNCRYYIVRVEDHGEGVPDTKLSEIFKPFCRVDDARDRGSGGDGFGLAIASQAIDLHKGCISAENKPSPDCGLIIEVRLPI